jgi:hypothetical protein
MNFPDLSSLKQAAQNHSFRQPEFGESEHNFRWALAEHVKLIDLVESQEIRLGRGWDTWTEAENLAFLAQDLDARQRKNDLRQL